jgi:hypothetical protein
MPGKEMPMPDDATASNLRHDAQDSDKTLLTGETTSPANPGTGATFGAYRVIGFCELLTGKLSPPMGIHDWKTTRLEGPCY